ncbi:MAG: hypothetical protein IKW33_03400 [Clostridia bacterium]|nr:hypothetical protein [Clostridia bacterium]
MELTKRKYHKKQVEEILTTIKSEYESQILENKQTIEELKAENEKLKARLLSFEEKEKSIVEAVNTAQKKAEEIVASANLHYAMEIERLKNFSSKWKEYFNYIAEKYPYYPALTQAREISSKLKEILKQKEETAINELENLLPNNNKKTDQKAPFDPKKKIEEYVNSTENGFDLDKVLNPGELHLEDLCKELGLMDEE